MAIYYVFDAALSGKIADLVKILAAEEKPIQTDLNMALGWAIFLLNRFDMARLLLDHGADRSACSSTERIQLRRMEKALARVVRHVLERARARARRSFERALARRRALKRRTRTLALARVPRWN
jgi:hypothetical protein